MARRYDWRVTESPKTAQLTGVESTDDLAYASGKRGVLLERRFPGDWRGVTLEGPTGNGHNLNDVSITDDGERIWYCGDSGSFGYYDRARERIEAHPGPNDHTDSFRSVVADGDAGEEHVYAASDTGRIVHASVAGETVTVAQSTVPHDGTTLTEIVEDDGDLFASDVGGDLLYSPDGQEWRERRLAKTTLEGLAVAETGAAAVTDGGVAYRDISLFEGPDRMKRADTGASDLEDIAAAGKEFVAAGGDGALVPIDERGRVTDADPGPGVTFYGVEMLSDRTILAVGSSGTIVSGRPMA